MTRGVPFLVVLAIALACRTPSGDVRADTERYVGQMSGWAPIEGETARALERILRSQFVDEAEVRRQIEESRPRILAHVAQLKKYQPQSEPVRRIHRLYVSAWEALLGGYDAIEVGFSSGDHKKLARGRESIAIWRDTMVDVARRLRELREDVGVAAPASAAPSWRERTPPVYCNFDVRPQAARHSGKSSARSAATAWYFSQKARSIACSVRGAVFSR